MRKAVAAGCLSLGLMTLSAAAMALALPEAQGTTFSETLLVTPDADNTLWFQISGATSQFDSLSFAFEGIGLAVTAAPLLAAPTLRVATFNDIRNNAFSLSGGTAYTVTVSGKTAASIPGGDATLAVNVLNGAVARSSPAVLSTSAVPEPESYAMLLVGLALMGAKVARRRVKS